MKNQKFSHKTPHLKGKQHQLDPNLDLKQSVHHATVQYVDWDNDGDVDEYDKKPKLVPDENPTANFATTSKKLIAKERGEIKHTKRGMAYEDLRKWFGSGKEGGVGGGGWDRYNTEGERVGKCAREPGEPKPKCLSKEKAAKMSKDEIAAAVKRKREKDPVADRSGKGGKPKMVSNKIEEQSSEERYCPMCRKRERRMDCSYGPAMWDAVTIGRVSESKKPEPDHEHSMARSELSTIEKAVKRLKSKMKGEGNIEAWVQSKITKAADYIDSAADYLDSGEHNVQGSMDEEKGPCWTGYKQEGLKKKGNKMVPNCVEEDYIEEKNEPTNPKLWAKWKAKAKAKFDVYPSAYANGWAAKGYKSEGGGWKSVSEETIEDLNGNTFAEVIDIIKPDPIKKVEEAVRIPAKTGNIIFVTLNWRGKLYMIKLFFPQTTKPNRQAVQDQIEKVYPGSRVQSYYVSDIKPGEQFLQVEDWQKKNREDRTPGMSQGAVDEYRKQNPDSKLQTAVTGNPKPGSKDAQRRINYCRRSKGQMDMHNIDCSKDPDKAICQSRRRWNCN